MNVKDKKIGIIALGKNGVEVLNKYIPSYKSTEIKTLAISYNEADLKKSEADLFLQLAANDEPKLNILRKEQRARAHFAEIKNELLEFIKDLDWIIFYSSMGSSVYNFELNLILEEVENFQEIKKIALLTQPFKSEGRKVTTAQISNYIDILIPVNNDLIFASLIPHDTEALQAFSIANRAMANALELIVQLLRSNNILGDGIETIREFPTLDKVQACIGVASINTDEVENPINKLLNTLKDSPLLGGVNNLKNYSHIFVNLIHGPKTTISEVKITLDELLNTFFHEDLNFTTNLSINNDFQPKRLSILLIGIKLPETTSHKTHHTKVKSMYSQSEQGAPVQLELLISNVSRGIFSSLSKNLYNSYDLDEPTHHRRKMNNE